MTNRFDLDSKVLSVSVIVTTFNRVNLLRKTLDAILCQTLTDFELLVIDNMSEDGTREYVTGLADSRIHYFRNPNNGVIAVNRNYGIRNACGRFVAFCDDDDLWLPDKLERQVSLLDSYPDVALCYTHAEAFLGSTVVTTRMNRRNVRQRHFYQLLRGNFFPNSSVVIRRAVFEELGLLTEDATLREDYEMWLRIARRYRLMGVDDSLIRYRMHPGNAAGNRATETLRAIRTVRSVVNELKIPRFLLWTNIGFQCAKYLFYRCRMRLAAGRA